LTNKKQTAWKKSRKFGDVYGGRSKPKITDRIFRRLHSISPPTLLDKLPIYIVDNPSRDFFFPLQANEIDDIGRQQIIIRQKNMPTNMLSIAPQSVS
jgi:hypothetical protein